MEEIFLSILSGSAGGATVLFAAKLRAWLHDRIIKKARTEVISDLQQKLVKLKDLPKTRSKYRVILKDSQEKVLAHYDGDDSQQAKRLFEVKLAPEQEVVVYKNGKFHDKREYIAIDSNS